MYEDELREEVSQGDIFPVVSIPYVSLDSQGRHSFTDLRPSTVMVLTRDCDYDKTATQYIIVAEVRPIEEISEESRGNIRKFRTANTFHLVPVGDLKESYVDLRRLDRVIKSEIQSKRGQRIASLTGDARLALQRQIAIFFGYNPPKQV